MNLNFRVFSKVFRKLQHLEAYLIYAVKDYSLKHTGDLIKLTEIVQNIKASIMSHFHPWIWASKRTKW
jgi:hypothetical protein